MTSDVEGIGARICIDLFAGAGGLSTGLELAGFEVVFANEIVPSYAESLAFNHPQTEVCVDDIHSVSPAKIRRKLGLRKGELDLLAGGPPCQGFSVNAPSRSVDDKRNHLFLNYLEFAKEFLPKTILIENVPGMVSFSDGDTVRAIISSLKSLGYDADVHVLYAPHYGVPQMRWRAIFLASRLGFPATALFPIPEHIAPMRANFTSSLDGRSLVFGEGYVQANALHPHLTVSDAISDLPPIENAGGELVMNYGSHPLTEYQRILRQDSGALYDHQCAGLGPANLQRLPHIPPGGSWRDIPFELLPAGMKRARRSDHTKRYGRLDPDGLASTILTKCDPHWGTYIHPSQDRVLSVREAARLQSFPDRIRFFGSLTERYEQVGNAVPPLFAKAIGNQIQHVLNGHELGQQFPRSLQGKRSQQELELVLG